MPTVYPAKHLPIQFNLHAYSLTYMPTVAYSLTFVSSARKVKQQQGQAPLNIIKCSMWIQGSQGLQRLTSGH